MTDTPPPAPAGAIGWKKLDNATKWHFFNADGRSLCGGWLTLGSVGEFGNDDSPENCVRCRKKVKADK